MRQAACIVVALFVLTGMRGAVAQSAYPSQPARMVIAAATPDTTARPAHPSLTEALAAIENADYATAAARLRIAAQQGDPRAQEMLGFMLTWGEALYGPAVRRDPVEGRYWLTQAAAKGREAAAYYLKRIEASRRNERKDTVRVPAHTAP